MYAQENVLRLRDLLRPFHGTSDDMRIFNKDVNEYMSDEEVDELIQGISTNGYDSYIVDDYESSVIECSSECTEIVVTVYEEKYACDHCGNEYPKWRHGFETCITCDATLCKSCVSHESTERLSSFFISDGIDKCISCNNDNGGRL